MVVKIGYIGSIYSCEFVENIARDIADIDLKTYTYEYPEEVKKLHEQAVEETDITCYSGVFTYQLRNRELSCENPHIVTPFQKYSLAGTLLDCVLHHKVDIREISIDISDRELLSNVEKDVKFHMDQRFVKDYQKHLEEEPDSFQIASFADFHEELYQSGKTKMAITSMHYVYQILQKRGIPSMFMMDTEQNLAETLEEAKRMVALSRLYKGMVAAMYIAPRDGQKLMETDYETVSAYVSDQLNIRHTHLHDGETGKQIVCYSTVGIIETNVIAEQRLDWVEELENKLEKQIWFGVGYGNRVPVAEEHALDALRLAVKEEKSNGYVITDDNNRIGPLIGNRKCETIRYTEHEIMELTNRTRTKMKTMIRFHEFMKNTQFQPFTVNELAVYSNISVRTAERFIKRMYESSVIYIKGQEQNHEKGRPRHVYALIEEYENKLRRARI